MENLEIVYLRTDELLPYARNARKHSVKQVGQIAASIIEFGFLNPVIIDRNKTIVAGHGRVMAAQQIGLEKIPVVRAEHLTDVQRRAYTLVDNQLALNSSYDDELLKIEISELKDFDFDLDLLGFEDLEDLLDVSSSGDSGDSEEENIYTSKVESPIYTPKGPKPAITDLFDTSRASSLIKEIEESELPDDEKLFLTYAAYRHVVFNYQNIAEYYAHSSKEAKNVMENSALVIIDYNKAIELGFVKLTKELAEAYENDN